MRKNYINITEHDTFVYVEIMQDRIDLFDTPEMSKYLHSFLGKFGYPHLIIDMRNVQRLDSAGYGLFITIMNKCKKKGNDAVLVCGHDQMMENVKIAKIDYIFNVFITYEEAEAFILQLTKS